MIFSVFTATFNRKDLLLKLYESLIKQDFKDFEWLIIDDGSTDGTNEVVSKLINDGKLSIKYHYKVNGGKHTAINEGVKMAQGALFIIVDSDDTLLPHSLQKLHEEWLHINLKQDICGLTGLSAKYNNEIIGTKFLNKEIDVNFADIYLKDGVTGDKLVAFKTEVLKKYPFPIKDGVNFVFEAVVWHDIAKKYKIRCINEVLQLVNYQNDGNSDSSYKLWYVKGLAFSYFQLIKKNVHPFKKYPKVLIWNYIHLISNSLLSKESYFGQLNTVNQKLCYIFAFPRGFWAYRSMKKRLNYTL